MVLVVISETTLPYLTTQFFFSDSDKKIVEQVLESIYTSEFSKIQNISTRDLTSDYFYKNINQWNLLLPEMPTKTLLIQKNYVSPAGRSDFVEITVTLFFSSSEKSILYLKTEDHEDVRYIENISLFQISENLFSKITRYVFSFLSYAASIFIFSWLYTKIKKKMLSNILVFFITYFDYSSRHTIPIFNLRLDKIFSISLANNI